jgi:type II secretory pathway pseudopilin PulG
MRAKNYIPLWRVIPLRSLCSSRFPKQEGTESPPRGLSGMRMNRGRRQHEQGYILITLLLFVALLVIAGAAIAPSITFQIKRDREEELIHRGVQYTRAIRHYYKKFGRYPTRVEELENSNNLRFLRRRYKDPITGQDFKLVHYGEFQMSSAAGIAGATPVSAMPGASPPGSGGLTLQGASAGLTATVAAPAQDNSSPSPPSGVTSSVGGAASGGDSLSGQVFGGGPIIGVVSTSKAASIREFNGKDHYNQWMFVYDPTLDRGGLITTPWQPGLQMAAPAAQTGSGAVPAAGPGSTGGTFGTQPQQPAPTSPEQTPSQN